MPHCPDAVRDHRKAMEKDPSARYQTAAEFAADLADFRMTRRKPSPRCRSWRRRFLRSRPAEGTIRLRNAKAGQRSSPAVEQVAAGRVGSVSRQLAAYIGPIAKVVVKRAADRCSSVDQLYSVVAGEIDSEKDRSRFSRGRRSSTVSILQLRRALLFQHLQRLRQTDTHAVERAGHVGDFVAAPHLERRQVGFAIG